MNKYINERDVRLFLEGEYDETDVDDFMNYLNLVADIINVRHGKWIGIESDGFADGHFIYYLWECSECHTQHYIDDDQLYSYCPDCGAKMEE